MTFPFHDINHFSLIKLKEYVRINKLKISLALIFIFSVSFIYGVLLAFIFKMGSLGFFHPVTNATSTITFSIPSYFTFRDLLVNGFLAVWFILFSQTFLKSATGLSNPFVSNLYDVNFQILIPVDPFISYFSCKIADLVKNIVPVSLITIGLFYPLISVLLIENVRLILLILNFVLGMELISLLGDCIFFISNRFRAGHNWAVIYTEKNNLFVIASTLVIPLIFLQLFNDNLAPTFQILSKYFYLPLVNVAISSTGVLFRSGIPVVSYFSTITLIIQIIFLLIINTSFVKHSSGTGELGDLLPILEYLETQKQRLVKDSDDYFTNPAYDSVDKNEKLYYGRSFYSLLKKEWLLFKRSNDLKMNYIYVLVGFLVCVSFVLFPKIKNTDFASALPIFTFLFLVFELDTVVKLFHSVTLNSDLLNVKDMENIKVKIVLTIIFLLPIEILFLCNPNLLLVLLIILIGLVSEALNTFNLKNLLFVIIFSSILSPFLILTFV